MKKHSILLLAASTILLAAIGAAEATDYQISYTGDFDGNAKFKCVPEPPQGNVFILVNNGTVIDDKKPTIMGNVMFDRHLVEIATQIGIAIKSEEECSREFETGGIKAIILYGCSEYNITALENLT